MGLILFCNIIGIIYTKFLLYSEKQVLIIYYLLFTQKSKFLLLTSNGSICGQWSNSNSTNQQWIQETVGNNVRFKNRATGLYLDGMGSTSNGSNLCQWGNSGSANQQWQIE
jgi:hypothetical protein